MRSFALGAGLVGIFIAAGVGIPTEASAQIRYGSWRNAGNCDPAPPPTGPGRRGVVMPQARGGATAQECDWVRQVEECPRLRDVVRHPGQCTGRVREQRTRSVGQPRS